MEAPLIEIGKSRGEEKCALRRFKEESEFRFQYVMCVVLYGRDPDRVVRHGRVWDQTQQERLN